MNYHVIIADQVLGPYTLDQLVSMEKMGRIDSSSQVMPEGGAEWIVWQEIRPAIVAAPATNSQPDGSAWNMFPSTEPQLVNGERISDVKRQVSIGKRVAQPSINRRHTNYPHLRNGLFAVLILNIIIVGIFLLNWLSEKNGDTTLVFCMLATLPFTAIGVFLAQAFLDLVDAVVKK